jgi:hypothetical protein
MAFGESWIISVMMRFTSNGSRVMSELATDAQAAESKVDRVTAAMTRLRNASTTCSRIRAGAQGTAPTHWDALFWIVSDAQGLAKMLYGLASANAMQSAGRRAS